MNPREHSLHNVLDQSESETKIASEWSMLTPLHESFSEADLVVGGKRQAIFSRWRNAARKAIRKHVDPWKKYNIQNMPIIRAKRYRYSSIRRCWTEDIVEVKMCDDPFARGAMRECFRLKKLSSMDRNQQWSLAQNYVAKRYIQNVGRSVIFEDVKLQMDCKLWAEEFNRYGPPKKIDIVQMCVLEMLDMPGQPLFHLEHYIEGDYVKYNSNSGFVSDLQRKTPQAFTHFTFERSGHQLLVVDIQGVGDLYTDPQIHTVNGTDYGDGNLGTRGMALFFHSHICNDICHELCLTEFDLSDNERLEITEVATKARAPSMDEATKFCRSRSENSVSHSYIPEMCLEDAMQSLRLKSQSLRSRTNSTTSSHTQEHGEDCVCDMCMDTITKDMVMQDYDDCESNDDKDSLGKAPRKIGRATLSVETPDQRLRFDSFNSSYGSSSVLTGPTEKEEYWVKERKKSVPAGLINAMHLQHSHEAAKVTHHISVLGQIHLDLARYHEAGRFLREEDNEEKQKVLNDLSDSANSNGADNIVNCYDHRSALYHLDVARRCGVLEAILTVSQMAYGIPHELLKDVGDSEEWFSDDTVVGSCADKEKFAFDLMLSAAEMGDRSAMLFVAEAYESGRYMGSEATACFQSAIEWYQRCMGFAVDEEGAGSDKPSYEILSKMAKLYQEGGYGLDQNLERAYELYSEAAEAAMECMKGKLANRYYELAEMCC